MLLLEVAAARTEKEGWLGDSQVPELGPFGPNQAGMGEVRNDYGVGGNRTASLRRWLREVGARRAGRDRPQGLQQGSY